MWNIFRRRETEKETRDRLRVLCKEGDYGICPPPMAHDVAINELAKFFLGEGWYVGMPMSSEQITAVIVYEIERRAQRLRAVK